MDDLLKFILDRELIDTKLYKVLTEFEEPLQQVDIEKRLLEANISDSSIREVFADYYDVSPYVPVEGVKISENVLNFIPEESARHYRVVPFQVSDGILEVGTNNPDNIQVREVLNFVSTKHNLPLKFVFMLDSDIELLLKSYETINSDVSQALSSLETELNSEIEANKADEKIDENINSYEHIKEDAPVTKIVATILRYAVDGNASDVHIEPTEKNVRVRFRVDGELQTSLELPKNIQMAVSARIKILSSMRLDERRKPQDGRFSATFDGRKIDFRVSVLPTNYGEKVVMRILDNESGVRNLTDVGIGEYHIGVIKRILSEPYGIILISGPTGSGKSTTLYAMLAEIDKASQNVMSLEDPIEYNMEGVSQSQMRPEIGYTFATGLRAALRQDPDIIMVGEIRDRETAQLAIQAALTGHLVISTIHTNNSIGVIPRLIDMGIDPYLIAPTLKLAIAQRLARRLKPGTGIEEQIDSSTEMMIKDIFSTLPEKYHKHIPTERSMKKPEPTPGCTTGLKGRVAIMETLEINDEIQSLILKNASEEDIYNVARSHGFMSMQEDAIAKALNHVIPPEEMNAFGSKIGRESDIIESEMTVDNPVKNLTEKDIMNIDENTNN